MFRAARCKFVVVVMASCVFLGHSWARATDNREAQITAIATKLSRTSYVGAAKLGDCIALSPDGKWIIYCVTDRSGDPDVVTTRYLVRPTGSGADAKALASDTISVRWSPDSTRIATVAEANGKGALRILQMRNGGLSQVASRSLGVNLTQDSLVAMRWSRNSAKIMLMLDASPAGANAQFFGGRPWESYESRKAPTTKLELFTVSKNTLDTISTAPAQLGTVYGGFDWSPDNNLLAFTATRDPNMYDYSSTLDVLDLRTGRISTVSDAPGRSAQPMWSPDGRKILFLSDNGDPSFFVRAFPAVFDLASRNIQYFRDAPRGGPAGWDPDSKHFLWIYQDQMRDSIAKISLDAGNVAQLFTGITPLTSDSNWSYSRDGSVVAFIRSAPTTPADLYIEDLDQHGAPARPARKITNYSAQLNLAASVAVTVVSWPSADHRFSIHGLLYKPRNVRGPLPTLVYNEGGPGMINIEFGRSASDLLRLAAAEAGYAVLEPNTRGRGGYGEAFLRGIRDGHSYGRLPLSDAMGGVDLLIQEGVSDNNRLMIAGHSYGGYLSEYALTQSNRFRAAVIWEGHIEDLSKSLYYAYAPVKNYLARDLYGVVDPYNAAEYQRLFDESPGFHADKVKAPTLLLYGAKSLADTVGQELYLQYQHFGVPSQLIVYDEGHGFKKSTNIADAITRSISWMDKWSEPHCDHSKSLKC